MKKTKENLSRKFFKIKEADIHYKANNLAIKEGQIRIVMSSDDGEEIEITGDITNLQRK